MLPERLLLELRAYWARVRPTDGWLFPGGKKGRPISQSAVSNKLKEAVVKLKLNKRVTAHTLRHSFATHLLEAGTGIRQIQVLLGHASIRTTARYTQVSKKHIAKVKSPLDLLGTRQGAVLD